MVFGLLIPLLPAGPALATGPQPLFEPAQVDALCGEEACGTSSIADSNTSRKLAVASDGTIFATFWGSEGIHVARSTDRGASFEPAVRVTEVSARPSLAVSAAGVVFVSWVEAGTAYVSRSVDGGTAWTGPVAAGTMDERIEAAHLAVDNDMVYVVSRDGRSLLRSADAGVSFESVTVASSNFVFSDVHVDPLTRDVYVLVDNPSVSFYRSTDRGATFGAVQSVMGASVSYSVGALTSTPDNTLAFMAGNGTNLEVIDLSDESRQERTVASTSTNQGRSLAADGFGNVVSGNDAGGSLQYQVSNDFGATFSDATTFASGQRANAAINTTNGDLMFLYEDDGDVFLVVYAGQLDGYGLVLSRTTVTFNEPGDTVVVTATNTSGDPMALDTVAIADTDIATADTSCQNPLEAGASCTVTVTGIARGNTTLTIEIGGVTRTLPVSYTDIAVEPEPEPEPEPDPEPAPAPQPDPEPAPAPQPDPEPEAEEEDPQQPEPVRTEDGTLPEPGTAEVEVDGERQTATVQRTPSGGTTVTGDGFVLEVEPEATGGNTGDEGPDRPDESADGAEDPDGGVSGVADLVFIRGRAVQVRVQGFQPDSLVRLWLFSEPRLLGEFQTDQLGSLETLTEALDDDISACRHTLHAEGTLTSGQTVRLSLGVWVDADPYPFADVTPGSTHRRAIACLYDTSVVQGTGRATYDPAGTTTRGQVASMFARWFDLEATTAPTHSDVLGTTHERAIAALVETGVAQGFDDDTFGPHLAVTRGQFASMLVGLLKLPEAETAALNDTDGTHGPAIAALVQSGAMSGFADGTFRPYEPITRAQTASVIVRQQFAME